MGVIARALVARRGNFVLDVPAFDAPTGGTAVLGRNGAGKTTLLTALQGLIAADGAIERPRRAAAVFARPAVLRGTTLGNVAIVARRSGGFDAAESERRSLQLLDAVGLSDRRTTDARDLSTGERQRLALARALVCEPDVLFLDEPLANVDPDARPALRALLGLHRARGCTLVVATSFLADALALCTAVVVLEGGRLTYAGSVAGIAGADDPYLRALVREASATRSLSAAPTTT
jgi:tungstate transport system ATP-binding protein